MKLEYYIGIDFGGTRIRDILYCKTTSEFIEFESHEYGYCDTAEEEFQSNIVSVVKKKSSRILDGTLKGIGISCAANFDRITGEIKNWPNNSKWNGFSLKQKLMDEFHVDIELEDDANSVALYQKAFGGRKDTDSFLYVTVSTGIGCGIICNGKLYIGERGMAGEFGHIQMDESGPMCTCGKRGCLQAFSSGKAIKTLYYEKTGFDLSTEEVFELQKKENKIADQIIEDAKAKLVRALENAIIMLDISTIYLGGGVINGNNCFFTQVKSAILQNEAFKEIRIIKLDDSDSAGVKGALTVFL